MRIFPGWPVASSLDSDLEAGKVQVSIFPLGMEANTTRYLRIWQAGAVKSPTLFMTAQGNTVIVSGAVTSPLVAQNLAVLINGKAYLHAAQSTDTITSIATALASLIAADWPGTTNAGPVITVPGAFEIVARVGTSATAVEEIRRQKRLIQITIWAPTPDARKIVASTIDGSLADTAFITMPDFTEARVMYHDSPMTDMLSKARIYRRDLRYFIEYATTKTREAAVVVDAKVTRQDRVTGIDISVTDY
ncbi:hypothetical protein [Paraburkholderia sp.]|uniref:hypothetical protein n=1 Tax=Paraburkholderia sp. TaxID=1926495 RepID=UPI00239E62CC|nr:hypothetical protein [Paraburkholderia sp.]MDE1179496.1 hypothetical protein [Paraburkholderia sp.]